MEPPQYNGSLLGLPKREYLANIRTLEKVWILKKYPNLVYHLPIENWTPRQNLSADDYSHRA
jgi:hypothetical protein